MRPERVTPEQRYDLLFIARLQRLPCYNEILRHLTQGQSVRSLAAWLTNQKIEGSAGRWSRRYWEKLLQPLDRQVVAAKERAHRAARRQSRHPQPPSVETMTQTLAEVLDPREVLQNALTTTARKIWKQVDETMDEITAEKVLKFAFFIQQERVENVVALEKKLNLTLPNGYKDVDVLRKIGEALTKNEALRKGLPTDDSGLAQGPGQESDLVRRIREFDAVDRNLLRLATTKIFTMIQEESSGRFTADGLEPHAGGTAAAAQQGTEPDADADVSGDA